MTTNTSKDPQGGQPALDDYEISQSELANIASGGVSLFTVVAAGLKRVAIGDYTMIDLKKAVIGWISSALLEHDNYWPEAMPMSPRQTIAAIRTGREVLVYSGPAAIHEFPPNGEIILPASEPIPEEADQADQEEVVDTERRKVQLEAMGYKPMTLEELKQNWGQTCYALSLDGTSIDTFIGTVDSFVEGHYFGLVQRDESGSFKQGVVLYSRQNPEAFKTFYFKFNS